MQISHKGLQTFSLFDELVHCTVTAVDRNLVQQFTYYFECSYSIALPLRPTSQILNIAEQFMGPFN